MALFQGVVEPGVTRQVASVTLLSTVPVVLRETGLARLPPVPALPLIVLGLGLLFMAGVRHVIANGRRQAVRHVLARLLVSQK